MNDINHVVINGRLTADPELKYTQAGKPLTIFSLAVNRSWKTADDEKKDLVSFFNCINWGSLGESVICKYGRKGMRVTVSGQLEQNRYEDKDGNKRDKVQIVVREFQMPTKSEQAPESIIESGEEVKAADVPNNPFSDNDIPF